MNASDLKKLECHLKSGFPRLHDLYVSSDRNRSDNYFEHPNCVLAVMRRDCKLLEIENMLQNLDSTAWSGFKARSARLLTVPDKWGWNTQLFDCLNEARGYCFLKEQGYSDVRFMEQKKGIRTPDLIAKSHSGTVLAEVKTVHESEDENDYLMRRGKWENRDNIEAVLVQHSLSDALRAKLQNTIVGAKEQLCYPAEHVQRKIILLYIRLDMPHASRWAIKELEGFFENLQTSEIEIRHWITNEIIL